ncbi:MAG: helix-turn-helix transcriptional regulator [Bacteroidetes bacterium]|nr:helix-turn-helix transcriptional regulator [Bacteroidota bacterium]
MIGQKVRELREKNDFLLRQQLAAKLDIDTAQLSKMERGERLFKKEEIIEIAMT